MKIKASSKLLITSLAIVFLTLFSGLVVNLLTSDGNFGKWLESNNIGTGKLIVGVILSAVALIIFTCLQFRYSRQSEQTSEKENSVKDVETNVKKYYDSLKERYRKRYESKLDGRFEITLEVGENWNFDDAKKFKGEYEGKGQIGEAFECINSAFEKHGRLLIVGNPGVGKTVLLLKLALELLEKADIEKKAAFPVIFNLASWSNEYENFDDWLISVLNSGEGLSKDFAGKLLQEERIIFLLDGLDELARSEDKETAARKRARCLHSLNEYLDRGKQTVICCREKEFKMLGKLTGKDAPVSAKVKINDLSEAEVLNTLMKVGENKTEKVAAGNLLSILKNDKNNVFLKVLSTPFYFTTALEVFDKQIFEKDGLPKNAKDLEIYLQRKFIGKKLKITPNPKRFSDEKTKKWLIFLAELINKKKLIIFELADLQPSDLIGKRRIGSIIIGYFGIDNISKNIHTEDTVSLDFSELLNREFWFMFLKFWLFFGLFGLLFGLFGFLFGDLSLGLFISLFSFLILGVSVIPFTFKKIKKIKSFSKLENPYQRIKGGFLINLYFSFLLTLFFITGKVFAMFYLQNQDKILHERIDVILIIFWMVGWIILARTPLYRHLILRLCLYIDGKIPLKYATFLDYAAEARILEKDGGHWRFRHQNLQDYFADLDEQSGSHGEQRKTPMR